MGGNATLVDALVSPVPMADLRTVPLEPFLEDGGVLVSVASLSRTMAESLTKGSWFSGIVGDSEGLWSKDRGCTASVSGLSRAVAFSDFFDFLKRMLKIDGQPTDPPL